MKATNRLALIAGLALAMLAGCKKDEADAPGEGAAKAGEAAKPGEKAMGQKAAPAKMTAPDTFAAIPADTPYVIASFKPIPREATDKIFAALDPFLKKMQDELKKELERAKGGESEGDKIGAAILEELDGNLNRAGLEKLGISTEPKFAIYGIGVMPVFRIDLKDPAALKAAIGRVETKAGVKAPVMKAGDQEYWGITEDDVTVVIAIIGDELVFAVTPAKAADKTVPIILGQQKPAQSLASTGTLTTLASTYGFQGYGVGYIDFKIIANTIMGDAKGVSADVWTALDAQVPPVSDACKADINSMVDNAPRAAFGYTEMTAKKWAMSWIIETKPALGKSLAGLAAPVPGVGTTDAGSSMFSFGVGVDIGKAIAFAKEKAQSIADDPYKCELLGDLNEGAKEAVAGMNQPLPPFLNGIKGFNVVVKSADFSGPQPKDVKANVLLAVDKPADLIAMVKGMVPPLATLEVKDDGVAVPLPPGLIPPIVEAPHVAMKGSALAVTVGAGEEKMVGAILAAKVDAEPPLIAVSYDMSKFSAMLQKQMEAQMAFLPPEAQAEKKAEMQMAQSIMNLFGALSYSLHLTEKGIVLKQQIVLN
ncbi:MAG: hypothetical protein H6704_23285 [Myxococcales bacterium]|nr:hypothetical protein [Myxococcales bacterium]MCB9539156.1 hypothetical protein [Myxococcales bacterium]